MDSKNSCAAQQCKIVLYALGIVESDGLTTIQLREDWNIMHPAGRVKDLRNSGNRIDTVWANSINAQGNKHSNARYVLIKSAPPASLGAA